MITTVTPEPDASLVGAGKVFVNAHVKDDQGYVRAELRVDGAILETFEAVNCEHICAMVWVWDTSTIAAGDHEFQVVAFDGADNSDAVARIVAIDDLVRITEMEVTNQVDESGTLEIEVHVFDDDTSAHRGCAGSVDGLSAVDVSDTRYPLDVVIVDPATALPMGARTLAGRSVRFEVWEDDDTPVCPVAPNAAGNDLVGASPAMDTTLLEEPQTLAFGSVTALSLELARPLELRDTPPPPPRPDRPDEDPFDDGGGGGFGGGGCDAGGSGHAGVLVMIALAWMRRRRMAGGARE